MRFETWERIQKAIDCIRSGELEELAPGRHELFDGAYVNVFEYQTKRRAFTRRTENTSISTISSAAARRSESRI